MALPLLQSSLSMSAILYVEDDELTRQTVTSRLRRAGHEVTSFCSGEAAVEAAESVHPAIALLDLELPGIDGVETLRLLKARVPGLCGVICSAHLSEPGTRQTLLELGVDESCLVTKPARFTEILAAVAIALEHCPCLGHCSCDEPGETLPP